MEPKIERKCCHCNKLFEPDCRNRRRQLSCSQEACRQAMKSARQRRWLSKPENENYFRGSEHVERVREWRARNPGYWKRARKGPRAPLQDALKSQYVVLIGLISKICGTTLQDDIANTISTLLSLGHDILRDTEASQYGSKGIATT